MSNYADPVIGRFPDGKIAFQSRNLRGLIDYARKHNIDHVDMGECLTGNGHYRATFGNGVVCEGFFADATVMLGFFMGRGSVATIEIDRATFNKGSSMGRTIVPSMALRGRDDVMRFGPWTATAYRDEHHTPMVRLVRD